LDDQNYKKEEKLMNMFHSLRASLQMIKGCFSFFTESCKLASNLSLKLCNLCSSQKTLPVLYELKLWMKLRRLNEGTIKRSN